MRILVTGAAGSIGQALVPRLRTLNHEVRATDVDTLDVTKPWPAWALLHHPHTIIHLAGFKQAPEGEEDPAEVARINIDGTRNAVGSGARVILASTCKAADPETAYGASKLIAERIVLNAGGVVARLYNVREAGGNVFRLWESIPEDEPIPYTPCSRYFISMDQVLNLFTRCLFLPSGRYAVANPELHKMEALARSLYPLRKLEAIPKRRGDRFAEPKAARTERLEVAEDGIISISNPHDAAPVRDTALLGLA